MRSGVLLFALAVTAPGCRAAKDVGPYQDTSVLLIVIDTLRADRLPA